MLEMISFVCLPESTKNLNHMHTWYLSQAPQAVAVEKNLSCGDISPHDTLSRGKNTWEMWRKSVMCTQFAILCRILCKFVAKSFLWYFCVEKNCAKNCASEEKLQISGMTTSVQPYKTSQDHVRSADLSSNSILVSFVTWIKEMTWGVILDTWPLEKKIMTFLRIENRNRSNHTNPTCKSNCNSCDISFNIFVLWKVATLNSCRMKAHVKLANCSLSFFLFANLLFSSDTARG